MAKKEQTAKLKEAIAKICELKNCEQVERQEWGVLNFKPVELDVVRLFSLIEYLNTLPIEFLPDSVTNQLTQSLNQCVAPLTLLDTFSLSTQSNPQNTINQICGELHTKIDAVYNAGATWIPFLAYKQGDVAENIRALSKSIEASKQFADKAKTDINEKYDEINKIIEAAREASASAGVAVFTEDFKNESEALENTSKFWFGGTVLFAIIVCIITLVTWIVPTKTQDQLHLWQMISSKLILLSFLITATLWCGRMYKALRHQAAINKQKALGVKTFQAFSQATNDPQTKDAVLLETTRAIFAQMSTGFIDNKGSCQDGDSKIIEIARAITPQK